MILKVPTKYWIWEKTVNRNLNLNLFTVCFYESTHIFIQYKEIQSITWFGYESATNVVCLGHK